MSIGNDETHQRADERSRRPAMIRLGLALILLSGVFWFSIFAVPFLPLTVARKTVLGGGLFVAVQIAWWSGAALAGPAVAGTITDRFRRSKKPSPDE